MSITSNLRKIGVAVVATGAAFGLILGGSAAANAANEPTGGNTVGNKVAVGSDTIQDIYGSWANSTSPNYNLDSFKAFTNPASATITLKGTGTQVVARPAGSGDGVKLLSATYGTSNKYSSSTNNPSTVYNIDQLDPVVNIARSSSRPSSSLNTTWGSANLVYVPLARDAVSVAVKNVPSVTNLTTDQLKGLYGTGTYQQTSGTWTINDIAPISAKGTANPILVTGVSAGAITTYTELDPKLPQAGSGTRSFFLGAIGVTSAGAWVEDTKVVSGVTSPIAENDASNLTATAQVVPFSAAQWISQYNNAVPPTFVKATTDVKLISINGSAAYQLDPLGDAVTGALFGSASAVPNPTNTTAGAFGLFSRDVYSVVTKANFGAGANPVVPTTAGSLGKLVGTDLPGDATTIAKFGFLKLNYSGTATGWFYSLWAN
jgi:hypothetical protein